MAVAKPRKVLKLRTFKGGKRASVRLVDRSGGADEWRLFGEMPAASAAELAAWFESVGVPTERDEVPYESELAGVGAAPAPAGDAAVAG